MKDLSVAQRIALIQELAGEDITVIMNADINPVPGFTLITDEHHSYCIVNNRMQPPVSVPKDGWGACIWDKTRRLRALFAVTVPAEDE
jgi:hypothetical protein